MQQMNPNDPQVVVWSKWTGLTQMAAAHIPYSCFDHDGLSGGSLQPFTPRTEAYLMGVRFGWWPADRSDFVVYNHYTLEFMATQALYFADETTN